MSATKSLGLLSLVNFLVLLIASSSFAQTTAAEFSVVETTEVNNLTPDAVIAQSSDDDDDRIHYFGVGGTIGVVDDGDSALGDGGFSLMGRFSFNDTLSIHTASVITDDGFFSVALSTGWPIQGQSSDRTRLFPFVGAGVAVEPDGFDVSPLLTAGVDVPINDIFTGTARVNTIFEDGTDLGFVLGVGVDVFELF